VDGVDEAATDTDAGDGRRRVADCECGSAAAVATLRRDCSDSTGRAGGGHTGGAAHSRRRSGSDRSAARASMGRVFSQAWR
jgi:hypothetical protein